MRKMIIHLDDLTISADLIENSFTLSRDKQTETESHKTANNDESYLKMHASIKDKDYSKLCGVKQGVKILELIDKVHFDGR